MGVDEIPEKESVERDDKKTEHWRLTVMKPVLEEDPREAASEADREPGNSMGVK